MRIKWVECQNFRSLEKFHIDIPTDYSVICGKNNSGKSAIFKSISNILGRPRSEFYVINRNEPSISYQDDISHWVKSEDRDIEIRICLSSNRHDDSSFYEFIARISNQPIDEEFSIVVQQLCNSKGRIQHRITLENSDNPFDETATEETVRWLKDKPILLYHDSTSQDFTFHIFANRSHDLFNPSEDELIKLRDLNKRFANLMNKVSKRKKEDIEEILGVLGETYFVNLDYPLMQFDNIPYDLSLGESRGNEIKLENWGSGTRNRTLILSLILQARQKSRDINHQTRFSPIVILEEPEAFLHPSAQSGFGQVIEDLSSTFKIQIITSSHSPFLLSRKTPKANVLLERHSRRGRQLESIVVDTSGENWMAPFATVLGVTNEELAPWNGVLQGSNNCNLIVEGDIDKRYIESYLTERPVDGLNGIQISSIGGKDKLNYISMIRFIHKFSKKVVFLLDMDAQDLESKFIAAGLKQNRYYIFAGKDLSGRRRIEGIIPDELHKQVYAANNDLVLALQSDKSSEKKSAQGKIKELLLSEFEQWIKAGKECNEFDKLVRALTRCFQ